MVNRETSLHFLSGYTQWMHANDTRYLTLPRHYSHKLLTIEILFYVFAAKHGKYLHEGKMLSYGK